MVIAVDFDGTIVENRYPEIGAEIPFAIETLKMLIADRHRLVLWSCREGELLEQALQWCRERGVEFYAANRDYPEETTENNPHWRSPRLGHHLQDGIPRQEVASSHRRSLFRCHGLR